MQLFPVMLFLGSHVIRKRWIQRLTLQHWSQKKFFNQYLLQSPNNSSKDFLKNTFRSKDEYRIRTYTNKRIIRLKKIDEKKPHLAILICALFGMVKTWPLWKGYWWPRGSKTSRLESPSRVFPVLIHCSLRNRMPDDDKIMLLHYIGGDPWVDCVHAVGKTYDCFVHGIWCHYWWILICRFSPLSNVINDFWENSAWRFWTPHNAFDKSNHSLSALSILFHSLEKSVLGVQPSTMFGTPLKINLES